MNSEGRGEIPELIELEERILRSTLFRVNYSRFHCSFIRLRTFIFRRNHLTIPKSLKLHLTRPMEQDVKFFYVV